MAKERGLSLSGPDGLLKLFTRNVLETALNEEMTEHLGHFPTEQAALKCLHLVTKSLDPTGRGQTRLTMRWKPALNAFAIIFSNR